MALGIGPVQQVGSLQPQFPGKPVNDVNTGRIDTTFERTDIGPVNIRAMRQFLLRNSVREAVSSEIAGKNVADIHVGKDMAL